MINIVDLVCLTCSGTPLYQDPSFWSRTCKIHSSFADLLMWLGLDMLNNGMDIVKSRYKQVLDTSTLISTGKFGGISRFPPYKSIEFCVNKLSKILLYNFLITGYKKGSF